MTINGNFTPTGTVNFEVNSTYTTAGADYDQYVVSGTVDLSGATLADGLENSLVRWSYTFAAVPGGTEVTERWQPLPGLLDMFASNGRTEEQVWGLVTEREEWARTGMPETLAAIKQDAEAS